MKPGSRTFLCWQDGLTDTGESKPVNPACKAAQQVSGTTPFYNWFSVLRSDGAGRTRGFVPDGELCSGGNPNFTGFNLSRSDWPLTHLTSGATVDFSYNAWAAHPGWFHVYATKEGFDPTKALTWNGMEDQPFLTVDHPPLNGSPGTVEANYSWTGQLPANKSGRHIIYMVWQRSDSAETFYSCSDGGNGEVTGIHDPGNPTERTPARRLLRDPSDDQQLERRLPVGGDRHQHRRRADARLDGRLDPAGRAVGRQPLERQRDLQRPGRDGARRRLERCVGSREEGDLRVRRLGLRR